MIAEISAGLGSLKTAKDLIVGLNAALTQAAVAELKISLQGTILEAQSALLAAQDAEAANARSIADLEQEIVRLKDWSAEKERYELKAVDAGAFAYMPKEGMEGSEPPHWLCTRCFGEGRKSIIQFENNLPTDGRDSFERWKCSACGGTLTTAQGTRPKF